MLRDKLKEPKGSELDEKTASQMLENIFDACEVEPNSVPLSVLTSYSNYRRERFLLQRILLVFIMLFFLLLPLLFIAPDIQLTRKGGSAKGNPTYEVAVHSLIPVSRVTADINGNNVPVYEVAGGTYSIEPKQNGTLRVTVTLKNQQYTAVTRKVTGVDIDSPTVIGNKQVGDQIYLYLSDTGSGIDYENITAADTDGKDVKPLSYDPNGGYVTFDYPKESLNVFIPDKAGNTLHLILTVK